MDLKDLIIDVPNWPKPGVIFKDISPLIKYNFNSTINRMSNLISSTPDYFVGIESRGFIFASALATKFNTGIIMIRKSGKLPPPVLTSNYKLEYSEGSLEIKQSQHDKYTKTVIIVDDVLATGGTLSTAAKLCYAAGYSVLNSIVLIDLKYLHKNNINALSVIQYE